MLKLHFLKSISYVLTCLLCASYIVACTPLNIAESVQNTKKVSIEKIDPLDNPELYVVEQPIVLNDYAPMAECPILNNQNAYQLGVDDVLNIQVFGEPDLSGKYTLQDTGKISVPLIGDIKIAGCTLSQVEGLLYQKFTDGYLINPSISISLNKARPIYILGEVKEPGQYDYIADMNILKAVAKAGGFTYRANKKTANILVSETNSKPDYKKIDIAQKIKPGDIIVIRERFF